MIFVTYSMGEPQVHIGELKCESTITPRSDTVSDTDIMLNTETIFRFTPAIT